MLQQDNGQIYIFIRAEGFYPLELADDKTAIDNALCNPGTLRVEDVEGRIVWRDPAQPQGSTDD